MQLFKIILPVLFLSLVSIMLFKQFKMSEKRLSNSYYQEKVSLFKSLPSRQYDVVMIGDSLTDNCEWQELLPNIKIANRGIQGDTANGINERIESIKSTKAKKAFLMIGINDLMRDQEIKTIISSINKVINGLLQNHQHIYIQSVLYLSEERKSLNPKVTTLNKLLKDIGQQPNITFIDLNKHLSINETLNKTYTLDGIHLNGNGYFVWKKAIEPFMLE